MKPINLVDARARLGEWLRRVARGESIWKRIAPSPAGTVPRKRIDASVLRAFTERMPFQSEDAGAFVRSMRKKARY